MKRIRLGRAVEIPGMSIIPVELVVIEGYCHPNGIAISAECSPIGVILDDGTKRWAVGLEGEALDLDELIRH